MPEFELVAGLGIIGMLLLLVLTFWTIVWKGIALWIAAQEKSKKWFIAILVLNTFGILEIIYIFGFSPTSKKYIADWKAKQAAKKSQTPVDIVEASTTPTETKVEEKPEETKEEPKTPSEQ